jgi:transposase
VRSPFGRARRQSRHLDDESLLSPDRRHGQKKTLVAREQDRPDISRHRKRWRTYQGLIDPRRLVFIDETWTKTNMTRLRGWAPRGQRLVDKVPQGKWKTATFLAALRNDRIDAPCLFDGPINGERFHAYVEQFLVPTLKPGDVVILDNLGSHKGKAVRKAIRDVGGRLVFLPKYSPDLNPIEQVFAKFKRMARPVCKGFDRERRMISLLQRIRPRRIFSRPRWRYARSGPHKAFGVERRFFD